MSEFDRNNSINLLRILYPIWAIVGIYSIVYVPSTLIDFGNSITTAENISNHELVFRSGIVGRLMTQLLFIIIPLLLYKLFESVNKSQAILMVLLALVSVPISLQNETFQIMSIRFLNEPEQMTHYLKSYYEGMTIAMIFWGLWLFPLGFLVYKSGWFPKIIGIFLIAAGFGYFMGSLIDILFPTLTKVKSTMEYLTFGELIFVIWVLIKGVNLKTNLQQNI